MARAFILKSRARACVCVREYLWRSGRVQSAVRCGGIKRWIWGWAAQVLPLRVSVSRWKLSHRPEQDGERERASTLQLHTCCRLRRARALCSVGFLCFCSLIHWCWLVIQIRKMLLRPVELRVYWRKLKAFVKVKSAQLAALLAIDCLKKWPKTAIFSVCSWKYDLVGWVSEGLHFSCCRMRVLFLFARV